MLELRAMAFDHGGEIPPAHTADGADRSPALVWTEGPPGTQSYALVVDDPDAPDPEAPKRTWVHWVLYDLPAAARGLAEAMTSGTLPKGTREGSNDWGRTGWRGPSPPIGRHRYSFRLYALDVVLGDLERPTKAELEQAIEGHVLARAVLVGTYARRPSAPSARRG